MNVRLEKDVYSEVGRIFSARLKELGISQYRFVVTNPDLVNRQTLTRLLRGKYGTNLRTVALYADLLGLEIVIRPKQTKQTTDED